MLSCTATSGRTARLNGATAMADFGAMRMQANNTEEEEKESRKSVEQC